MKHLGKLVNFEKNPQIEGEIECIVGTGCQCGKCKVEFGPGKLNSRASMVDEYFFWEN
jgi:hypothetical protein